VGVSIDLSSTPRGWAGRRAIGETTLVNGVLALLGAATGILTARLLGPEGRGLVALGLAVSTIAATLVGLGLQQAFGVLIAARSDRAPEAVGLSLWSGFILGGLTALAGWTLTPLLIPDDHTATLVRLAFLAVPVSLIGGGLTGVLQGLRLGRRFNATRLLAPGAYCVGILLLAITGAFSAQGVVIVYVLALVLAALASYALVDRSSRRLAPPSRAFAASAIRYGMVVSIGGIALAVNRQLAIPVLSVAADLRDVGYYAVGMSYALPVGIISVAIALHTLPDIAAVDPAGRIPLVRRRTRSTVISLGAIGGVTVLGAPLLIPLAFGEDFRPAVTTGQLLVVAAALASFVHLQAEIGRGIGRPGLPAAAEGGAVIGTIVLLPLVAPTFGIVGVAAATVGVNALVAVLLRRAIRRLLGAQRSRPKRARPPHSAP
jgi:O-antigen/teichoic acid export membrane protein